MDVWSRPAKSVVLAIAGLIWASGPTVAHADSLTPIAPYADPNSTGTGLIGINNAGWTTGSINYLDGSSLGFLRSPDGVYTTFSDQFFTQGRAVSNSNTVIGYSSTLDKQRKNFREFSYSSGSLTRLANPTTGQPLIGIAQGINDAGVTVGTYLTTHDGMTGNYGFILNGSTLTTLSIPGQPDEATNARGITNDGTVVGWIINDALQGSGFVYKDGAYIYVNHPNDNGTSILEAVNNFGIAAGGYTDSSGHSQAFLYNIATKTFSNISVPGSTSVITFGINDGGQYVVNSDAGQFIFTPGGPSGPGGAPVFMPVSGENLPLGENQFAINVTPETTYYIDPHFATGFEFLAGTGPLFSSVTAPTGIAPGNLFQLWLWNPTTHTWGFDTTILGGTAFNFTTPLDRFELRGIPLSAAIDADHPDGFITGLTFAGSGEFNGFQDALTGVPEPATWALVILGLGFVGLALRQRNSTLVA